MTDHELSAETKRALREAINSDIPGSARSALRQVLDPSLNELDVERSMRFVESVERDVESGKIYDSNVTICLPAGLHPDFRANYPDWAKRFDDACIEIQKALDAKDAILEALED